MTTMHAVKYHEVPTRSLAYFHERGEILPRFGGRLSWVIRYAGGSGYWLHNGNGGGLNKTEGWRWDCYKSDVADHVGELAATDLTDAEIIDVAEVTHHAKPGTEAAVIRAWVDARDKRTRDKRTRDRRLGIIPVRELKRGSLVIRRDRDYDNTWAVLGFGGTQQAYTLRPMPHCYERGWWRWSGWETGGEERVQVLATGLDEDDIADLVDMETRAEHIAWLRNRGIEVPS